MKYKSFCAMFITNHPKVSILVPVYNAEQFIGDTVKSVLEQTFTDFELILLDDASTDKTSDVIKAFDDRRIVYARNKENLGISDTRNKLVEMAKGEYIAILDHDDICLTNRLKVQVDFLDKYADVAMVGSWFELMCPKSVSRWRRLITNLGWVWCHPLSPDWNDLWKGNVMMHPTIMYRRKLFQDLGIKYRKAYSPAEDYDFVRQAKEKGLGLANIPQILVKYSLHGGNWSLLKKREMMVADRKIKQELADMFGKKVKFFYPYWLVMIEKLRFKFMVKEQFDV